MKHSYIFSLYIIVTHLNFSQIHAQSIGINTSKPDNSAVLDIRSNTRGLLIPRTSSASRMAVVNPANGLMLYDTTVSSFWFYNGNAWSEMTTTGNVWSTAGNANTEPIGLRSVRPSVAHQVCVVGDSRSPRKLALVEEKLGMFAPPSPAALAIFPNYDPKPNASARIAVLGKLPAAVT